MIQFNNVSVSFGDVSVLENVNAYVPRGGSTAFVGPNGAGKTTLLNALLQLCKYTGTIILNDSKPFSSLRIGYVPQRLAFDRSMPLTVLEFLSMNLTRKPMWLGIEKTIRSKIYEQLASVKGENLTNRKIGDLSGGELQRILLAHALQKDPELVVLDEPSAGLDMHGEIIFCELLEKLREEKKFTQIMVSHDLSTVVHHATHVIMLNRTAIAEGNPLEVITPESLSKTFGVHLGVLSEHLNGKKPLGGGVCCRKDSCCG